MTALITLNSQKTEISICSLDFLNNYINPARQLFGENPVSVSDFNDRIMDELDLTKGNFLSVKVGTRHYSKAVNLNYDQLMLVGMRESKAVRKSVLEKLKKLQNQQPQLPTNFSEALLLAAEQAKQLELAAPSIEFVEKYVKSDGLMTFREVAKILEANEREFRDFLVDARIMYKLNSTWTAYAAHLNANRFEVKIGTTEDGHAWKSTLFTAKGLEYVTRKFKQWEKQEMAATEQPKQRLILDIYMNCKSELNMIIRNLDSNETHKRCKNITENFAVCLVTCGGFHDINVGFSRKAANLGFNFDHYANNYPKLLAALNS